MLHDNPPAPALPARAPTVERLFLALALLFLLSLAFLPYPGDFLLKVSPILCLALAVAAAGTGGRQRLVLAALFFSGIGDVVLERGYFLPGLGAFLIAHLCYIPAFGRHPVLSRRGALALIGLAAYTVAIMWLLTPHLGDLAPGVYLYMGVICVMAAAAICGRDNHPLVGLGAVLFVLSDSLIAINRFVTPLPGAKYAIMLLYYAGQYWLTHDARRGRL